METSEEEEEEPTLGEAEKLLMNSEEQRLYAEQVKRSVRRKKSSPKRVSKQDPPILDERYAASLLEYYSKHRPYYPVDGSDPSRPIGMEGLKTAADQLVLNDKEAGEMSVGAGPDEAQEYSAEVAAIVQSVVSAHMDEVIAARMAQGEVYHPQSHETVSLETKSSLKKKIKPQPQQKDRNPEQQHVNMQRFRQKLAVTYPGVQAVDECTLLCTCNTKVKLGRARMLHNYTNYLSGEARKCVGIPRLFRDHLKRCQNPPSSPYMLKDDDTMVSIPMSLSEGAQYPGEFAIPSSVPKEHRESLSSVFLNVPDRENLQKHFTLTVPTVPICEMLSSGPATSGTQSVDFTMASLGQAALLNNPLFSVAAALRNATIPASQPDLSTSASQSLDLSVTSSQTLDLSVTSTSADLSMTTTGQELATSSMGEYSELPDLSAMNALTMIQGKAYSEEAEMEEPTEREPDTEMADDAVPGPDPTPVPDHVLVQETSDETMIVIEASQSETVVEEPINLADP